MTLGEISRRRFLGATAAVTLVATLLPDGAAQAAPVPAGKTTRWRGRHSANGWPILGQADRYPLEGSGLHVELADGDAAVILAQIARRFHYEIDQLRDGDVHGFVQSRNVEQAYESNYLSGSALAIRPRAYPVGVKGGLYPRELIVVRDILAELDGAVAWGGDFASPKESHFEIAHPPGHAKVTAAARRITGWRQKRHGLGAGATDAFDPQRRAASTAFSQPAG